MEILVKKLFKKSVILVLIVQSSLVFAKMPIKDVKHERNDFQFAIHQYHSSRQSGQVVNIYVKYAYQRNLPTTDYPDYRILRTKVLQYMEPTEELPTEVYWEIVATKIGKELMHDFPLAGVSVQLYVLDNPDGGEPGDHGPIFTTGDIMPFKCTACSLDLGSCCVIQ